MFRDIRCCCCCRECEVTFAVNLANLNLRDFYIDVRIFILCHKLNLRKCMAEVDCYFAFCSRGPFSIGNYGIKQVFLVCNSTLDSITFNYFRGRSGGCCFVPIFNCNI